MTIKQILANARERLKITHLTPMQHKMAGLSPSLPAVTLIAPTGSGKTLAFALPLLERIGEPNGKTRALVIAPSRELVLQIAKVISALAPELRTSAIYGGHNMLDETRSLQANCPDILVGTPGRILDHLGRQTINLRNVSILVADEYDKSLELGFQDEMQRIFRRLSRPKLTILTSATELPALPEWLGVKAPETIRFASEIEKPKLNLWAVKSPEADKLSALLNLLLRLPKERTMVFVNHRESAERVAQYLRTQGLPVVLYHGALNQDERENAIDMFANGSAPIMVATDLAARGLDIPQVRSVVHYHLPSSPETLTHRNGRAARMGAEGDVFYLLGPEEIAPDNNAKTFGGGVSEPWNQETATIFFHAGRKEKLSKGDILGALTGPGALAGNEVGAIALHDHRALAAIPARKANAVIDALNAARIKSRRIRVSRLN